MAKGSGGGGRAASGANLSSKERLVAYAKSRMPKGSTRSPEDWLGQAAVQGVRYFPPGSASTAEGVRVNMRRTGRTIIVTESKPLAGPPGRYGKPREVLRVEV